MTFRKNVETAGMLLLCLGALMFVGDLGIGGIRYIVLNNADLMRGIGEVGRVFREMPLWGQGIFLMLFGGIIYGFTEE